MPYLPRIFVTNSSLKDIFSGYLKTIAQIRWHPKTARAKEILPECSPCATGASSCCLNLCLVQSPLTMS